MNRNRTTTFVLAGLVLAILVGCGVIGYLNDSGRTSPAVGLADNANPTNTPNAIDLVYCYSPVSLCVVSFGQDNAGNMLIVIRNNIPGLTEFYAKLNPTESSDLSPTEVSGPNPTEPSDPNATETPTLIPTEAASNLYPCQKVQFASDIYYCMGSLIPDGAMVTMDVYSKNDDHLVASGRLPVSVEATPEPVKTEESTATTFPFATQTIPSVTQLTPALPYPYP